MEIKQKDCPKNVSAAFKRADFTELPPETILDILLTYVVPKREIKTAITRLLYRFGSVSATMEADISDVTDILEGNEYAASLLKLIPSLGAYYHIDKLRTGRRFDSIDALVEYCVYRFMRDNRESYSVLLLDANMRMLGIEEIAEGTECSVEINLEKLGNVLFRYGASEYILVHNHPACEPSPSDNDVAATERVYDSLLPFNKIMVEHIIISGNRYTPIMQAMRRGGHIFRARG